MKKCVNSACQHELEDYQKRCPYCGFPQSSALDSKVYNKENVSRKEREYVLEEYGVCKERNLSVTIWLYLALVFNSLAALCSFFPKVAWGSNYPDSAVWLSIINGLFFVLNIFAIVQLLQWKKMGFLLLCVSCFANAIICMLNSTLPIGVLSILVWYFVLQLKKDGKSCWEQLTWN